MLGSFYVIFLYYFRNIVISTEQKATKPGVKYKNDDKYTLYFLQGYINNLLLINTCRCENGGWAEDRFSKVLVITTIAKEK